MRRLPPALPAVAGLGQGADRTQARAGCPGHCRARKPGRGHCRAGPLCRLRAPCRGRGRMIRTRGLAYTYPTGDAPLRFPDVDLNQGDTLLLRGRSGSGKSTWLSLVAGLRGAGGGDLFVAGLQLGTQRSAELDAWRARSIGFLPQKLHLSGALTVADNLALVYFAAGLPRD